MATLNIKNFPASLYRKLKARARREHRSVAQEVTHILERAVEKPEPQSILDLEGLGARSVLHEEARHPVDARTLVERWRRLPPVDATKLRKDIDALLDATL